MKIMNNGWIMNSVAVPAQNGRYLVCCENDYVTALDYCHGWNCRIDYESGEVMREHEFDDVIAWMLLPELPEGVSND